MTRVKPIPREQLPEFEPVFQQFEKMGGFVPNSLLTMAHRPELLKGYMTMGQGVIAPPEGEQRYPQLPSKALWEQIK